jgi:predicted nucleic acid-binding protein
MAGNLRFMAMLDACVLYPATVRDVLLSLAAADFYHAKCTERIQAEWRDNLLLQRPTLTAAQLDRTCMLMQRAVPELMVFGWEPLEAMVQLPDPDDRHVLAAAITAHADVIVTFNTKDFPAATLDTYRIECQHPDEFILNQIDLNEKDALKVFKRQRLRLRNPTRSPEEWISGLERVGLPLTAARLRESVELI